MPGISWTVDPHNKLWFYPSDFRQRDTTFIDGLNFNHLKQLSGVTNGNGRQLDLIFGNSAAAAICDSVHRVPLAIIPEDTYHPALETCITVIASPSDRPSRLVLTRELNFRKLDNRKFIRLISTYDWSSLDAAPSIDEAVAKFTS
uniref:Uncharacterized protein n=1 Tax=Anopheles maculatus TaxID=74869 RepID=A0A182T9Z6_9DIPT